MIFAKAKTTDIIISKGSIPGLYVFHGNVSHGKCDRLVDGGLEERKQNYTE